MATPTPDSSTGLMVLIPRLARQIVRRSEETLLGMHMRDLMALTFIRDHDGVAQQDLADVMCMDSSNVVLVLNDLEDRGHITRRRDPNDRRRHRVDITDAGRAAANTAEHAQTDVENNVLRAITDAERTTLHDLLSRILHSAEPHN